MKAKGKILLLLIIILASYLRLWRLNDIPEGFHSDEAAFGYNAYSILLTSKDEYGKFLPLILRSFDDYKGAVYSYLIIPFIKVFGLSELAVRLPSAIFGVGLTLLSFLIVMKLTGKIKLSILTSFIMAISPWSVFLSRVQSDPLVAVFFVLLSFYFFLIWLEKGCALHFFLHLLFILVSFFTYASPRLFFPIYAFLIFLFYFNKLNFERKKLLMVAYGLILTVVFYLVVGNSGVRFGQTSFLKSPTVILPLEQRAREDKQSQTVKIFHNRPLAYNRYFIENFFQYLSVNFLFLNGGLPAREIVPQSGIFYLVELPFLLIGLYFIIRKKNRWGLLMIVWIFLTTAILSFTTDDTPNYHRFFLAILPFELIIVFGLTEFINLIKQKSLLHVIFLLTFILLIGLNSIFFLHKLFIHQPIHDPKYRGYAYKELNNLISKYLPFYTQIVITKGNIVPYIYILFYQRYDPKKYQALGSPRDYDNTGFDKFFFVPENCPLQASGKKKILYINRGDCPVPAQHAKILDTVKWEDGSNAFILLESDAK